MLRKDEQKFHRTEGTADAAEIERFNTLAEEWLKPDGAFRMIHGLNTARLAHIHDRLIHLLGGDPSSANPLRGKKIIDVGCAVGLVSERLAALGADVLGIDPAERNIRIAQRNAGANGTRATYRHALPEQIAADRLLYDAVVSLEVIEHVADQRAFLVALAQITKPGGILVLGTINRTPLSFFTAIVGAEYVLGWLPRGTHDWRRFVKPEELAFALGEQNLTVVETTGLKINPLTQRWRCSSEFSTAYLQFHRKLPANPSRPGNT